MADTSLILGLAGIGGAVVAGSLGPLTQRRIEREKRRDQRRASAETVLRAVRMIDLEFGKAQLALIQARQTAQWFPAGRAPRFDAWESFVADIAGEVSPTTWRALLHAHAEVERIAVMYDALSSSEAGREAHELPFDDGIADDFQGIIKTIQTARILVRPINLGGSSYVPGTGFWFPETPELVPESLEATARPRRRFMLRQERPIDAARGEAPEGSFAPMPYGMIFVDTAELDEEQKRPRV